MNLSDAHTSILCYTHTRKLTYMHTYRHKCIQIAFMYDHRFHFLCSKLQVQIHNSMMPLLGKSPLPHKMQKITCFSVIKAPDAERLSLFKAFLHNCGRAVISFKQVKKMSRIVKCHREF